MTARTRVRYKNCMKRVVRWLAVLLVVLPTLFLGVSWVYAQRLTRARPSVVGAAPQDFPYPLESVRIATDDGHALAGWLTTAPDSRRAVVLLHGWGGNRKQMVPRARFFCELGYTALLYDARACGESSGDSRR